MPQKEIYIALLIFGLCSPTAAIDRQDRPQCRASEPDSCSVLTGSTDTSGFLVVNTKSRAVIQADSILATIDFHDEQATPPNCELRGEPKAVARTNSSSMQVFTTETSRLPTKMRWFYVCHGGTN